MKLDPPTGIELPPKGFEVEDAGFQAPSTDGADVEVVVDPHSDRLQLLTPFVPLDQAQLTDMRVLLKAKGKCTTDHISMAGPWFEISRSLREYFKQLFYRCHQLLQRRGQQCLQCLVW